MPECLCLVLCAIVLSCDPSENLKEPTKIDNSLIYKDASFLHFILVCVSKERFPDPGDISLRSCFTLIPLKKRNKVLQECS